MVVKRGRWGGRRRPGRRRTTVCVWRLCSSHNALHSRSCKRSALQLLVASSAQQDKESNRDTALSSSSTSIVSNLVTLPFSSQPFLPCALLSIRVSCSSPPTSSWTWWTSLWSLDSRCDFGEMSKILFLSLSVLRSRKDLRQILHIIIKRVIKEKCILKGYILYKLKSLLKSHFLRLCEFLSIKNSESHFWIARNISFLREQINIC